MNLQTVPPYVGSHRIERLKNMADRNRKVIGYFAFTPPTEVVCTGAKGDACVISGSVRTKYPAKSFSVVFRLNVNRRDKKILENFWPGTYESIRKRN